MQPAPYRRARAVTVTLGLAALAVGTVAFCSLRPALFVLGLGITVGGFVVATVLYSLVLFLRARAAQSVAAAAQTPKRR